MALITLLDDGMGQELVARSGDQPTPLWATRVMIDHPGLVEAIHADYFAAGASVATTNTYNILHDRLVGVGLDHYYQALHLRALMEAHEARAEVGRGIGVRIARRGVEGHERLGRWRWVVERTLGWLHRFRRLRIRYERRADIHQDFLSLACTVICLRYVDRLC